MLRVCVIGMGPIGRRHATLLQADPLADLVGVCDRLRERADAAAAAFGVPAFYEAEIMLRALAPDVTHVATGRRGVWQRPLRADHAGAGGRLSRAGRKAHLQHR